jgi:hypothetical protein
MVLLAIRYYSSSPQPAVTISAERVLPPHVAAGQSLPVLIRVEASEPVSSSLLLKESLPPGCQPLTSSPKFTSSDSKTFKVKWVSKLEGEKKVFAYLVRTPEVPENSELVFSGRLLAGQTRGTSPEIGGDNRLKIANFHWADRNRDRRIDDEEILMVYDLFSGIENLDLNRDLIDEIWAAGGYEWDKKTGSYLVTQ